MKVLDDVSKIEESILNRGTVVTLGAFDGMHIGHMTLVRETERMAEEMDLESVILTFPLKCNTLMSQEDRYSFIEQNSGIKLVVEQPFVKEFSNLSPGEFAERYLKEKLNCKCMVIGFNNRFGRMASGDVDDMKKYGAEFGFEVVVVPPVCINYLDSKYGENMYREIVVSSTAIKEQLSKGDIAMVKRMLGRDYIIKGMVQRGKMLGKKIGFPTANIYPDEKRCLPKNGVYAASVRMKDGRKLCAMVNVGVNPTVTELEKTLQRETGNILPKYKVEANIFDMAEDVYGQEIEIALEKFMRDECKFSGVEELKQVLCKDKAAINAYFIGKE